MQPPDLRRCAHTDRGSGKSWSPAQTCRGSQLPGVPSPAGRGDLERLPMALLLADASSIRGSHLLACADMLVPLSIDEDTVVRNGVDRQQRYPEPTLRPHRLAGRRGTGALR